MIIDTAFFLDLIDGDEKAVRYAGRMEEEGVPQRVPAQVVYELFVGVGYTDRPAAESGKLQGVLDSRPIVETTAEIARKAGRIDGTLRRRGERVPVNDLIVGATAIVLDEPVLTRNVDDFERVPGVDVESY